MFTVVSELTLSLAQVDERETYLGPVGLAQYSTAIASSPESSTTTYVGLPADPMSSQRTMNLPQNRTDPAGPQRKRPRRGPAGRGTRSLLRVQFLDDPVHHDG